MLSRRNIRIKVMQVLYSMNRDVELPLEEALERYRENIEQSFQLFLFNLGQLLKTSKYAKKDFERRNSKHLPSEEDKIFTAALADNPLIASLEANEELMDALERVSFETLFDSDVTRLLYSEFCKQPAYKEFLNKDDRNTEQYKRVLLDLYKSHLNNETFLESIIDHFPNWVDDKSLIIGSMKKLIKGLPAKNGLLDVYKPNPEATDEFGEHLLREVCVNGDYLLSLIKPTLKNWDADRVAVIDMILLKMALVELMNFSTIPTKVTLNEFLEISKQYSTAKSKDFINGILDRLMKQLNKKGMIKKDGRGLIE